MTSKHTTRVPSAPPPWEALTCRGQSGSGLSEDEALEVVEWIQATLDARGSLEPLFRAAEAVRKAHLGAEVVTCSITNAKSGRCAEKCAFCSQSAHFETAAPAYGTKSADEIVDEARAAWAAGAREFSIVMAGRAITSEADLQTIEQALRGIRAETGLMTCASLGLMDAATLGRLKAAGLQAAHHNLETARSHHAQIVESHSYDDEIAAVRAAAEAGLHVCTGAIFGMGERWDQRVELALELRALDVDSVPINFLDPRPGTPLADLRALTADDCLAITALLRLMLPDRDLIVCGGREVNLGARQEELFRAGASGMMLGNYLTTAGRSAGDDHDMLAREGLKIRQAPNGRLPGSVPGALQGV